MRERRFTSEFEHSGRLTSGDYTSSGLVGRCNYRVFLDAMGHGEETLWRRRSWPYSTESIEIREEIAKADAHQRRAWLKRAERLGLEGLSTLLSLLMQLDQYPLLDDDVYSQMEQEEQAEHWRNYGEGDLIRLLVSDPSCEYFLEGNSAIDVAEAYWKGCNDSGRYPERIDDSAWDFGTEERYGKPAWAKEQTMKAMGLPLIGPTTLHEFIQALPYPSEERQVWTDVLLEMSPPAGEDEDDDDYTDIR